MPRPTGRPPDSILAQLDRFIENATLEEIWFLEGWLCASINRQQKKLENAHREMAALRSANGENPGPSEQAEKSGDA
jgi:hypothetical protein